MQAVVLQGCRSVFVVSSAYSVREGPRDDDRDHRPAQEVADRSTPIPAARKRVVARRGMIGVYSWPVGTPSLRDWWNAAGGSPYQRRNRLCTSADACSISSASSRAHALHPLRPPGPPAYHSLCSPPASSLTRAPLMVESFFSQAGTILGVIVTVGLGALLIAAIAVMIPPEPCTTAASACARRRGLCVHCTLRSQSNHPPTSAPSAARHPPPTHPQPSALPPRSRDSSNPARRRASVVIWSTRWAGPVRLRQRPRGASPPSPAIRAWPVR